MVEKVAQKAVPLSVRICSVLVGGGAGLQVPAGQPPNCEQRDLLKTETLVCSKIAEQLYDIMSRGRYGVARCSTCAAHGVCTGCGVKPIVKDGLVRS